MSNSELTITVTDGLYPIGLGGDVIELQGCINSHFDKAFEIVAVRGSLLILRSPSLWYLLGIHFHQAWLKFRWAFADARLELSEIWEQAKADWKRTFS